MSYQYGYGFSGWKMERCFLYYLKDGPKRFNEINQLMPTITEMTLSLQLK